MAMAPAAARAPPRLLSKTSFLVPTTVRLGRRAGVNRAVILGVAPRDGEWGADPDASSGSGRMVDEDMATLRRRIREARAALSEDDDTVSDADDADSDAGVPAGWTELERRHHRRGAACLLEAVFLACAKLIQAVDAISSAVSGR